MDEIPRENMSTEIFFDGYSLNLQFYEGLNNITIHRETSIIRINIYEYILLFTLNSRRFRSICSCTGYAEAERTTKLIILLLNVTESNGTDKRLLLLLRLLVF